MRSWRRDPETATKVAEWRHVVARDGGCVFRYGSPYPELAEFRSECRGQFGTLFSGTWVGDGYLTVDHVQEGYGRMGLRADSTRQRMVCVCWGHHLGNWSTRKECRAALRALLLRLYPEAEG
jgi:hypothetical protein